MCVRSKRRSWSQVFLAETGETGDKNRDMSHHHAIFCEESLRKIDAKDVELFQNGSVYEFCCLKALITLEQMNTSVKTLMVRL